MRHLTVRDRILASLLVGVVSALLVGLGASSAKAAQLIAQDGLLGAVSIPEAGATCYFPAGNLNQPRVLTVHAPLVSAYNMTGNVRDWNWVRYRVRVLNYWTHVSMYTGQWSNWAIAYDDAPAPMANYSVTIYPNTSQYDAMVGNSLAQVDIEWWTQTQRIGGITAQVSWYQDLFGGNGTTYGSAVPPGYAQGGYYNAC